MDPIDFLVFLNDKIKSASLENANYVIEADDILMINKIISETEIDKIINQTL